MISMQKLSSILRLQNEPVLSEKACRRCLPASSYKEFRTISPDKLAPMGFSPWFTRNWLTYRVRAEVKYNCCRR
jgi:hypothetical protein